MQFPQWLAYAATVSAVVVPLSPSSSAAQLDCPEDTLRADVIQAGDSFGTTFRGRCVDLDGSRAVVSAPFRTVGNLALGSVFVFDEIASGWGQAAQLVPSASTESTYFGYSVALEGGRVVAGAPGAFWPLVLPGSVSVFEESAGWAETAVLSASGLAAGARFGDSVAMEGSRIVVGAPRALGHGAVYVFEFQQGAWVQTAMLEAASPESGDEFGESVALEGSRIVVGASADRHPDGHRRGAVFIFDLQGSQWVETAHLESTHPYGALGTSVDLAGSTVVGGAPFGTIGGPFPSGAFIWEESAGGWSLDTILLETTGNDSFGQSVSLEGNRLVVGAHRVAQVLYMYERGPGGWDTTYARTRPGSQQYGNGVAPDGDRVLVADAAVITDAAGGAHLVPFGPLNVEAFCFCPNAGCHNPDPNAGCANETGQGARLWACGTTSVSRDDLVIQTTNTGANTFGILFMGRTEIPPQFFGIGMLCVGDPSSLARFPAQGGGPLGVMNHGPGLVSYTQGNLPPHAHITAGDTWNFQLWYRDGSACSPGYNASSALRVTFTP